MRTVEAGWQLAIGRAEVVSEAHEITLTECLRDGMREALVQHRFPWRKTMIIAPGTESRSRPGMTAPDGRTDIPLFLTRIFGQLGEHDPHAILECKRVAEGDTGLAREYVVEGIDRFRSGKYAENHSKGFMVGYILRGTRGGVVSGINNYLVGRSRGSEALGVFAIDGLLDGWISEHPRLVRAASITLHHAMLALT